MASRLGRIEFYITSKTTGLPLSGVTIDIRRQGAQIVSGGATTFTIDNPGAIRHSGESGTPASDSVKCYKADGTVRDATPETVTALSATSITVGGDGFTGTADDDRLSPTTNLPTIYEDSEGNTSIASSRLTTDANGYAACWAAGGAYDAVVNPDNAGGQPTQTILPDVEARAADSLISNSWGTGTQTFFRWNTLRALSAGDKLAEWLVQGASKANINRDGLITCVGLTSSAVVTVSSGGITVTGNSTITGTLGGLTGLTVASGGATINGGGLTLGASGGNITQSQTSGTNTIQANTDFMRELDCKRLGGERGTGHVSGDYALSGGFGTTASISIQRGYDTGGTFTVTSSGTGQSANPSVTLTFKDGAFASNPIIVTTRDSAGNQLTVDFDVVSSTTQGIFTFRGTPVAGETYKVHWQALGL